MTKQDNLFHDYVAELFAGLGRIRIRKMFGGAGVYADEDMFALLDDGVIYIKADGALRSALEAEGGRPFTWTNPKTGKTLQMSYVSLPESAVDDPAAALGWARQALNVAIAARRAKVKSPRRGGL